jgi:hypothetical protein
MESPQQILLDNGVKIVTENKVRYLEFSGKKVIRPDLPSRCYQVLIDQFGIKEPRLLEFRNISS